MSKVTIGNAKIAGFVNQVSDGRILLGTGSYKKGNETVYKESVSVFFDAAFNGTIPAKGDYVEVRGDVTVGPRKDKPELLNSSMNVRFADQVTQLEKPTAKDSAPAAAGAGQPDI